MGMHGDLVNGLCYTVILPAYLYLWWSHPEEDGATLISFLFVVVSACSWISYCHDHQVASEIANYGMAASIAAMNLYQWPHKGQIVIYPQYIWSLGIVSFNSTLSFPRKMRITGCALTLALWVSYRSPFIKLGDALPLLLGTTAVFVLFHYLGGDLSTLSARWATMLLAGAFSYEMTLELGRMLRHDAHVLDFGYTVLKSGLFASLGLAAAGAFQQTSIKKDELEVLVVERTREIEAQAEELRTLDFALQASETAIAITDSFRTVVWCNPALEHLRRKGGCPSPPSSPGGGGGRGAPSSHTARGRALAKVLGLDPFGEMDVRLTACFDPKSTCQTELAIGDAHYTVEVSPFPSTGVSPPSSMHHDQRRKCQYTKKLLDPEGDNDDDDDEDSVTEHDDSFDSGRHSQHHNHHNHPHQASKFLVALKDVTEQRARERAEKLVEQEMFMKQGMKESMETLTHELRSPLQGIMGMASCLLDNETATPEETKENLSIIMASSRHLLTLINNLLDIRKCDARMMDEFPLAPIPLSGSLTEAAVFCRPMASITGVDLKLSLDDKCDHVQVLSNVVRLQQVIINIVSNAIKYAPHDGTVLLRTKVMTAQHAKQLMKEALALGIPIEETLKFCRTNDEDGSCRVAVVSVTDTGPGIAGEASDRVFRKFAKVTQSASTSVIGGNRVAQPAGTGLGLNLCVKFVKRMDGNIWVCNNPLGGATFSFCVPVVEPDFVLMASNHNNSSAAGMDAAAATSAAVAGSLSRIHSCDKKLCALDACCSEAKSEMGDAPAVSELSVLVVDDIPINLKVMERMLKGIGVGTVRVAQSGQSALSIMEHEAFRLVITDIQMPDMDGMQLSDAIRSHDALMTKPLVVGLTAETSDTIHERCAKSGISHVLHKPITKKQLQTFIFNNLHLSE
jgi:signal transduction histidine kinase/PAS domain-containing protein